MWQPGVFDLLVNSGWKRGEHELRAQGLEIYGNPRKMVSLPLEDVVGIKTSRICDPTWLNIFLKLPRDTKISVCCAVGPMFIPSWTAANW